MAKAGVELPDPLQSPADAAPPLTSTDDLLAQLAGEEIDRLLAEVDDQSGAAARAPEPASRANAAPSSPIEFSGTPDVVPPAPPELPKFDDADAPAAAAAVAAAAEPDVTAELDAFFKTAVKAPAPPPLSRAPTPDAGAADLVETSAAERAGLNAPVSGAELSASTNAPAAAAAAIKERASGSVTDVGDDGPLPLYLKPLEWINAPLEACPTALRDFIGKAAIITLVNAAAVLCYVLLFRRH
jgi:hypothetical protein